ncbi:MAG: hypothetical protein JXN60_02605 [Lentisphaerae bacterium]|nr:hypothetical protein [Lentisphaerota bacterium]
MIERYLDDLENRINPEVEDQLQTEWEAFTNGTFGGDIFSPKRIVQSPPGIEWPNGSLLSNLQIILDSSAL